MRVLVACEFSQVVTKAFRDLGHEAYSCDIEPCEINPEWHFECDIKEVLNKGWDLMIAHPPCTFLTVTGNKWFKPEYKDRFPTRHQDREDAKAFFMMLANAPIDKIAIENPIGIMSTYWRKPDQVIQPWQFGHEASKSTCLWLKNLPLLTPTNIVGKGEFVTYKSGKRMTKWYADAAQYDAKTRAKIRNRTFQGIADAMAMQWGGLVEGYVPSHQVILPDYTKRNLLSELATFGLSDEQCSKVLEWTNTLPIHVTGNDIKVVVENGVVKVGMNEVSIVEK